jgi:membrane associated rhomboid family serine protease
VTKATFYTCVIIQLIQLLSGRDEASNVCFSIHQAFGQLELYRVLLAPVFHAGPLHLAFNMFALLSLAPALEASMGSVRFGCASLPSYSASSHNRCTNMH